MNKDNKSKLLAVFFDDPIPKGTGFQLRELSRRISLAPKSVKIYLEELEKNELIISKPHRIHSYPLYYANTDSTYFKLLKKLHTIQSIQESGLLDYLVDKCAPETIILFGSASKGEDNLDSDIDIFVESAYKHLELSPYEKRLNRKISVLFDKDFDNLSIELKKNLINGYKLYGYLDFKLR